MRQRKDNNTTGSTKKSTSNRQSKLTFLSQQTEQTTIIPPSSPRRRAAGKPKRYLNQDFVNEFTQPNKKKRQQPVEDTSVALESIDYSSQVGPVIDSSLPLPVFQNVSSQSFEVNTVVSNVGTSVTLPQQATLSSSLMPDNTINISLPVVGNEILDGQGIPLAGVSVVETTVPVVPICTLRANAQHPVWFQTILREVLESGAGYDAVWYCRGGIVYRVHKFVLAAFSDHMKAILPADETLATIYTPDIGSEIVLSILCLLYTGQANVTWKALQEINESCRLIGFCGKDMTATHQQLIGNDDNSVTLSYPPENKKEPVFAKIKIPAPLKPVPGLKLAAWKSEGNPSSLMTQAQLEDFDNFDNFMDAAHDDPPENAKLEPDENAIKIELESDREEEETEESVQENAPKVKRKTVKKEPVLPEEDETAAVVVSPEIDPDYNPDPLETLDQNKEIKPKKKKTRGPSKKYKTTYGTGFPGRWRDSNKQLGNDLDVLLGNATITEDGEVTRPAKRAKSTAWADKIDARVCLKQTCFTYGVVNKNKGLLSHRLPLDLFENTQLAKKVKTITVCPICLKCFTDRDLARDHRIAFHKEKEKKHPSIIRNNKKFNEFKCDKCDKEMKLKHIVWFAKHYKFCGIDDFKANEILKEGEEEPDTVIKMKKMEQERKTVKEGYVVLVANRPKYQEMSKSLLGKIVDSLYGCRKCYQAFESELALENHISKNHEGQVDNESHGTCYDPDQNIYTCPNCKIFKTNKNVVFFIYHLNKCKITAQGAVPMDDEEDVDDDTFDDFVDPWGIISLPLKVSGDRSKWMCEAIFGQSLINYMYPCHICYSIFSVEEELREHFRITHPGLRNSPQNGTFYDKEAKNYICPCCTRIVCKKQRSSIYFSYHMLKCTGKVHPVSRSCPDCNVVFTNYTSYRHHIETKCGTKQFVCHVCGLELKTQPSLKIHLRYAHTTIQAHKCNVCDSAFKREFDLLRHMKKHMGTEDWSCEQCGKSFVWKKALQNHKKSHMAEADKPFSCQVCGNRFSRQCFLTNHMTTHSSFRGFACEKCNARVKTRDTLATHRRKVHGLFGKLPEECIIKPTPEDLLPDEAPSTKSMPNLLSALSGKSRSKKKPVQVQQQQQHPDLLQIKEEVLPLLEENILL